MASKQALVQIRIMKSEEDDFSDDMEETLDGISHDIELDSLNDRQLRELLDEAIQYKNPKDRLGKSQMFQELLEQAEADECDSQSSSGGRAGKFGLRGRRVATTVSGRTSTGGSLQNISSTSDFDTHHATGARRKTRTGRGVDTSVSARQREGGSLPSNVNTDNYFRTADSADVASWRSTHKYRNNKTPTIAIDVEEIELSGASNECTGKQSSGQTASASTSSSVQARRQTLKHSASNELPMADKTYRDSLRRHNSSCDEIDGRRMNDVARPSQKSANTNSFPSSSTLMDGQFPQCYRVISRDELAASSEGVRGELYTTSASLEVESVDSHMQIPLIEDRSNCSVIEPVQLDSEYPSVQSIMGDGSRLPDCSNRGTESFRQCGKVTLNPRNPGLAEGGARYTSFETENAVKPTSSKKKSKRGERNVAVSTSENTPGYQGYQNLSYLLKFIESDKDKEKNKTFKKHLQQNKKSLNDKKQKSLQKSSSLEEISQRNIEDLTVTSSMESEYLLNNARKSRPEEQRRSWGDQGYVRSESQDDISRRDCEIASEPCEDLPDNESDSDFQMVTKKQRRRRGANTNVKRPRNRRSETAHRSPRRKSTSSVPPSERSADSDLDSVHSLPAGTTRNRPGSDSDCDNVSGASGGCVGGSRATDKNFLDAVNLTNANFPSLPLRPGMRADVPPTVPMKSEWPPMVRHRSRETASAATVASTSVDALPVKHGDKSPVVHTRLNEATSTTAEVASSSRSLHTRYDDKQLSARHRQTENTVNTAEAASSTHVMQSKHNEKPVPTRSTEIRTDAACSTHTLPSKNYTKPQINHNRSADAATITEEHMLVVIDNNNTVEGSTVAEKDEQEAPEKDAVVDATVGAASCVLMRNNVETPVVRKRSGEAAATSDGATVSEHARADNTSVVRYPVNNNNTSTTTQPQLVKKSPHRKSPTNRIPHQLILGKPNAPKGTPRPTPVCSTTPSTLNKTESSDKCKTVSKSVGLSSWPPVILLDDRRHLKDPAAGEITFGFEVNQQLLSTDQPENDWYDSTDDTFVDSSAGVIEDTSADVLVEASCAKQEVHTQVQTIERHTQEAQTQVQSQEVQTEEFQYPEVQTQEAVDEKVEENDEKEETREEGATYVGDNGEITTIVAGVEFKFMPPPPTAVAADHSQVAEYLSKTFDNIIKSKDYVYYGRETT